jgi:hypothetical protein
MRKHEIVTFESAGITGRGFSYRPEGSGLLAVAMADGYARARGSPQCIDLYRLWPGMRTQGN